MNDIDTSESLIKMRPMDLGDILDGTIRVYRRRPWLFVGILAAIAGIPMAIYQISLVMVSEYFSEIGTNAATGQYNPFDPQFMYDMMVPLSLLFVCMAANFFLFTLATGATVHGINETILGRDVTFRDCMKTIIPIAGEIIAAKFLVAIIMSLPIIIVMMLAISFSMAIGPAGIGVVFLALPVLYFLIFYFMIKYLFVPQVVVIEKMDAFSSVKRSWGITNGFGLRIFWFVFVIGFIMGIIAMLLGQGITIAVSGIEAIPGSNHAIGLAIHGLLLTVVNLITQPVTFISQTLIYYDVLVRKEGFDLIHLARSMGIEPAEPDSPYDSVPIG